MKDPRSDIGAGIFVYAVLCASFWAVSFLDLQVRAFARIPLGQEGCVMWELVTQVLSQMLFLVLHVVNSSSFPKPLSHAQEREALAAMRQGDTAARQKLIEHNLRLVAHIIKKYHAAAQNQEDLVSIGTIGLIKAVDTFDETKGPRLATYAARCIENATLSQMSFWLQKELPIGELPSRRQKNMYTMSHTENGETKHSPLFVLSFRLMALRKLLEAHT